MAIANTSENSNANVTVNGPVWPSFGMTYWINLFFPFQCVASSTGGGVRKGDQRKRSTSESAERRCTVSGQ